MAKFCRQCGTKNEESKKFCISCGNLLLPATNPPVKTEVGATIEAKPPTIEAIAPEPVATPVEIIKDNANVATSGLVEPAVELIHPSQNQSPITLAKAPLANSTVKLAPLSELPIATSKYGESVKTSSYANKKKVLYITGALIALTVIGGGVYWKQTSKSIEPTIDIATPNATAPTVTELGVTAANPTATPVTADPEVKPVAPVVIEKSTPVTEPSVATPPAAAPVADTPQEPQNHATTPKPVKKPKIKKVKKIVVDTNNESRSMTEHEPVEPVKTAEPAKKEEPAAHESSPTEAEAANPPKEKKTKGLFRKLFKGVTENGGESVCTAAQRSMNQCN